MEQNTYKSFDPCADIVRMKMQTVREPVISGNYEAVYWKTNKQTNKPMLY